MQCGAVHLGPVGGMRSVGAQTVQLREVSLSLSPGSPALNCGDGYCYDDN